MMPVELHTKHKQLQDEGAELIEYSSGYITHCNYPCKLIYASKIVLGRDGKIMIAEPCVTVSIMEISAEGVESGTKEDILRAIEEKRIPGDDAIAHAVQNARFLFLHEAKKILIITKSEEPMEQHVQERFHYYRSTQREEAIAMIISSIKERSNHFLGKHNIQDKDMMSIAVFVSLQLP